MFASPRPLGKLDCGVARADHWDEAYSRRGVDGVSWYQAVPAVSLELVETLGVPRDTAVIDVGGGGAFLARELVARGFVDITVLDVSQAALDAT
jgi:2-polyprenyl-3-methyl-5-hydroxy-6-metoxy-1,4-benzoquinol methylase